jgi:FtsP/CotA-like multicopper oxidase with cupredoxin domain
MRFMRWSRTALFAVYRNRRTRFVRYTGLTAVLALALTALTIGVVQARTPTPISLAANPAIENGHVDGKDMGDGTYDAPYDIVDGVKVFHLTAAPITWNTGLGGPRQAYAFNGMIPGPNIHVNQGDKLRIIVQNKMPESTSVHWHGMILPNDMDGVPGLTQDAIPPGGSYTYEWTAIVGGTHWYHSHMDGGQESKGLYGALEITPRTGDFPADHDYRIEIGDGNLGFIFNGMSYPSTPPLEGRVGERIHIRLINTGPEMFHAIHIHGGPFQIVAQDGMPEAVPQWADTADIGIGQTYDLIWTPTMPGKWMLHCHIFSHSETKNGMQGMVSILDIQPAASTLPTLPLLPLGG